MLVVDGGSRNGITYGSYKIFDLEGNLIESHGQVFAYGTNNTAEYMALVMGLKACLKLGIRDITVFSDSELVIKQLSGEFKVNTSHIEYFYTTVIDLVKKFDRVTFKKVNNKLIKNLLGH